MLLQEVIQSLHLHIDSLKQQVGSLLDEADAKQQMMQAIQQQVDVRDNRIQVLLQQLADSQGQLADAVSALEARNVLLKKREQELAEREADLATFRSGRQLQQQQQQQLPQKLQRVGSVASTIHRCKQACISRAPMHAVDCIVSGLFLLHLLCESVCKNIWHIVTTSQEECDIAAACSCALLLRIQTAISHAICFAAVLLACLLRNAVPEAVAAVTPTPSAPPAVWMAPPTPSAFEPPPITNLAHNLTNPTPPCTISPATAAAALVTHIGLTPSGAFRNGAAQAARAGLVMQMMTEDQTGAQRGAQIGVG